VPLVTDRSVADGAAAIDRLRRGVIEASKQCGRNRLMEIESAYTWRDFAVPSNEAVVERWFAHPTSTGALPATEPRTDGGQIEIAVGPEGGWTEGETALARDNGWRFVDLGPRILRVETAAIALAMVAIVRRGDGLG
jgi:16S rRNA (uracil1498-N3)-methyltransferase